MPSRWDIKFWPECDKHVFLSHSAEDREELVLPVVKELERRGLVPWIDRNDYPTGRDGIAALQEEVLRCRHVIYFVTPAILQQGRGWPGAERALAAMMQQYLTYGVQIAHVELPLLFVEKNDVSFQRSVWRSLIDKAETCYRKTQIGSNVSGLAAQNWDAEHVQWASDANERFVVQEQLWASEAADGIGTDPNTLAYFQNDRNLMARLFAKSLFPGT